MGVLTDLALRRPWALLAGNLAVLTLALVVAIGAPDHLGIGSLALDEDGSGRHTRDSADLVIVTTGDVPVGSSVYDVALRVISSQVRSDSAVASVHTGQTSKHGRSTELLVTLSPSDEAARQQAVERIEDRIDPGPLRLSYRGEIAEFLDARHDLAGDLWRLELLATPLVLLVLLGAFGLRLVAAPVICGAIAIAGSLAGLRVVAAFADVSLLGIAPAAVLGLAVGVEAPLMLIARLRHERTLASPLEALHRALDAGTRGALVLGMATTAATAGLAATSLDQAPSMILACGLAVVLALASALTCTPALLTLAGEHVTSAMPAGPDSRLARVPRALTASLTRSRLRAALATAVAVGLLVAAAAPVLHGETSPFAGLAGDDQSLFGELAIAAGVSAAALSIVVVAVFRSPRVAPVVGLALLPPAAACGLAVLVFQDGHLAVAIGQERQAALETGAVASLLAALCAVAAFRCAATVLAVRSERSLGHDAKRAAEGTAGLIGPAVITSTLVVVAATGVLAGAGLYPAREFGLAVAAGLLLDLVLVRAPLVAALARWGS